MHSSTQNESGTVGNVDPIQLITYLALNKDRIFTYLSLIVARLGQSFLCKEEKKKTSHCLIRQKASRKDAGVLFFFFFAFLPDDEI